MSIVGRAPYALLVAVVATGTLLVPSPAQAAMTCGGKRVTITGTSGNDVIHGTRRADVIAALGGNDLVRGRGGNDTICGGEGTDRLYGDSGDDRLYGGLDYRADDRHKRGDILAGGPGSDLIVPGVDNRPIDGAAVPDRVSWRQARRGVHLDMPSGIATGEGRDRIVGSVYWPLLSDHGDRVVGTTGNDHIETFLGSDRVWAGRGDDLVFVDDPNAAREGAGPSADVAVGGPGRDWIIAREGRDRLIGGDDDDLLEDRGRTADSLSGGHGSDELEDWSVVGAGDSLLGGGSPGIDSLIIRNVAANRAHATLDLAAGTLRVQGVPGTSRVDSFAGGVHLSLSARPWTVIGSAGADYVVGPWDFPTTFRAGAGDDRFFDGTRDDTFEGGEGVDEMLRNEGGVDTCLSVEVGVGNCEQVSP